MGGDRKAESDLHTARVVLDLAVDGVGDLGEFDDGVEAGVDLLAGETENAAEHVDVFATGEDRNDATTDLENGPDASVGGAFPRCRIHGSAQDLEQGRLSGAVDTDNAHGLPGRHFEVHVLQYPAVVEGFAAGPSQSTDHLIVHARPGRVGPKALPQVAYDDRAVS
jgi:hypothetical protein